ncbi:hypothetical protein HYT84_00625, partial [Candidatus Micrarchaeota archaeon]|nr:hypothetical protein [Candidatus Micrarchaeota archaeon]
VAARNIAASERMKTKWADPEFRTRAEERARVRFKTMWETGEFKPQPKKEKPPKEPKSKEPKPKDAGIRKLWATPEFRAGHAARHSRRMKEKWQDEAYREKMLPALEEAGKKGLEGIRVLWQDPDYKERKRKEASATLKRLWKDEEYRRKVIARSSRILTKLREDPDFVAKGNKANSKRMKKLWEDPEFRAMKIEHHKKVMSRLWADPVYRERQLARLRSSNAERSRQASVNRLDAEVSGGFVLEKGRKADRSVAVPIVVPDMERDLDIVSAIRRGLKLLPPYQCVLVCEFFGIDMDHEDAAIREAIELGPTRIKKEIEAALLTLRQNPYWRELIGEEDESATVKEETKVYEC